LSGYAVVQKTLIDGRVYFDRQRDIAERADREKRRKRSSTNSRKPRRKRRKRRSPTPPGRAVKSPRKETEEKKPEVKKPEEKPKPPQSDGTDSATIGVMPGGAL